MKQPLYNYLVISIVIILLAICIFLGVKVYNYKPVTIVHDSIVYQTDTIIKTIHSPKPEPDQIIDCIWIYQEIDTAAILADYNKVREYTLPLVFDSLNSVHLHTAVYQNELQAYDYTIRFKPSERIVYRERPITPIVTNRFFIGAGISGWSNKMGIVPSVALLTKNNHLYSLDYNIINPEIKITGYWIIKFNN